MTTPKLLSDAELAEIRQWVLDWPIKSAQYCVRLLSHIAAQAAEIERLKADGERYRALRGLAIQHTEVVICVENHANDDEAPEYKWSIDLGSNGESVGSGGTCDEAIDNARDDEGR